MKSQGSDCGLDIDATCCKNGYVVWLGCKIRGNGSVWQLGLCSNHWLRGWARMHVMLGCRKLVI